MASRAKPLTELLKKNRSFEWKSEQQTSFENLRDRLCNVCKCLSVFFFIKHFRHYLYDRKFTVVTDHQALVWLHNTRDTSSRLLRWRLKLMNYEYEIKYRPGKINMNADALSRNPPESSPTAVTFPATIKRGRGRPRKIPLATPSPPTQMADSETDGIGSRVKARREALKFMKRKQTLGPSITESVDLLGLSYSSDDETDFCDVTMRRVGRKKN